MGLKKLLNGMNAIGTKLKDSYVILNKTFEDERGFFMESFNLEQFRRIVGHDVGFVPKISFDEGLSEMCRIY